MGVQFLRHNFSERMCLSKQNKRIVWFSETKQEEKSECLLQFLRPVWGSFFSQGGMASFDPLATPMPSVKTSLYKPVNCLVLSSVHILFSIDHEVCEGGVIVDRNCFRLPYRKGPKMNKLRSRDFCQFHGGVLAELPTQEVYQAVFDYVKRSWYLEMNMHQVHVWLDSVYQTVGFFFSKLIDFVSKASMSKNYSTIGLFLLFS